MKKTVLAILTALGSISLLAQVTDTGNRVGIGISSPTTKLDVFESGGSSGNSSALRLRSGNSSTYTGNNQILMSYNSGTLYTHSIKTRHHSYQVADNAIDFYVWHTADQPGAVGSKHVMSLNAGKVGIGTLFPSGKLESQSVYIGGSGDYTNVQNSQLKLVATSGFVRVPHLSNNAIVSTVYNYESGKNVYWGEPSDLGRYYFRGRDIFVENGSLAIGTSSFGSHKLAVEGSIGAREIKVEANGWSDFVFEDDYDLRTLEEVENYISKNKHLPGIPSEAEVTENGINLGKMNAKLLEKIEELTLYVIDMNNQMKSQTGRIERLEQENYKLKKEVSALKNE